MIIQIELEIEDDPIPNRLPTEIEKRTRPCSWLQCPRCKGLVFHRFKRKPLPEPPDSYNLEPIMYNEDSDQASIALKICIGCKKISMVQ